MKPGNTLIVLLASLALLLGGVNLAEAKRMGSGGSFGSKFSQSQPVKRNAAEQPAAPANAAQTQNAARQQQLASKGGMMGMIGALALGGILGALFFGGAFENINLFDIVMFALLAFVIFKLMSAWMRRNQPTPAGAHGAPAPEQYRESSSAGWGTQTEAAPAPRAGAASGATLDALRGAIPKGFDQRGFLDGAKTCFARLQQAWDEGDLADIRQFTTDPVFAEIQDQYRARGAKTKTEVVTLEAELLNVIDLGSRTEATVLFTGTLIEDGGNTNLAEIWHFIRANNSTQPNWTLDGIQQVED
ncbi:MAG: Tim44-like domain-containing protein [Pseudomonadota bacterium]